MLQIDVLTILEAWAFGTVHTSCGHLYLCTEREGEGEGEGEGKRQIERERGRDREAS
jgi:hypothetical protein